jgi:hypothetical protein
VEPGYGYDYSDPGYSSAPLTSENSNSHIPDWKKLSATAARTYVRKSGGSYDLVATNY